jgi:nucleotide-binding universal stress UspA family protein
LGERRPCKAEVAGSNPVSSTHSSRRQSTRGGEMFQRILVPSDGSEHALRAVRLAGRLAKEQGATLVLLTVITIPQSLVMATGVGDGVIQEYVDESSGEALGPALAALREMGVDAEVRIEMGSAAEVILDEVVDLGADLVVMGKRGVGELKGLLLGSVSSRVAHHLAVPVMLVP